MNAVQHLVHGKWSGEERGRAEHRAGADGEIKGPGPFRSMSLVVLGNFQDLGFGPGPGFQGFPRGIKGLSGTNVEGRTR
jgi:hypothetical protein